MSYVKLHSSITASTIWNAPDHTRILWITMMALADRDGIVEGSIPGLAVIARIPLPSAAIAIESFLSPDPWSRTKENEGRRIEAVEGGWRLLNYEAYREKLSEDNRRSNAAERAARYRERQRLKAESANVSRNASNGEITGHHTASQPVTPNHIGHTESQQITVAEAEAEAEAEQSSTERKVHKLSTASDDDEICNTAQRLYDRHPKKRDKYQSEQVVVQIWNEACRSGADPGVLFRLIDERHSSKCNSEDWTKESGRYCPSLAKWLLDEGWKEADPKPLNRTYPVFDPAL